MIIFASIFSLISLLKALRPKLNLDPQSPTYKAITYLPSGIAFAVGFLNSPSFSVARLIGGFIAYKTAQKNERGETPLLVIVIASGFVLGEGVLSIVSLVLTSTGYGALSCWGCGVGGGGYCSGGCS